MRVIWVIAFIALVLYIRTSYEKEKPIIAAERECIQNAVGYNDVQECFRFMDRNKEARENR